MLLQRRPNQKASDLAVELGVSVRTLHRYFTMLDEMGIPVYSERGPYGGFSLVRGYRMPPLVLTPEEAAAVYLGTSLVEEMWGRLYREAARGALAKIESLLPEEQQQEVAWVRRALLATGLHRADFAAQTPRLEELRRAAHERRRVQMLYRSSNRAEPARRELDPYALVHRWGWWYVIGYCHLRQGLRSFRVDRIQELALLDRTFDRPAGFDVHAYLAAEFQAQPLVRMRLRFQSQAAHLALNNQPVWEAVERQPDGSVEVVVAAPDPIWAASTALSFGPAVEVLEPAEMRQMVREWALAVAGQYKSTNFGD
jgi:predicted DNA-binding transcriptional regulator YafY